MASTFSRRRNDNRRRLAKAVRGSGRIRALLRRLPNDVRAELLVELRVTGRQIYRAVLARTPSRTGALRGGITERVLPRSLRLQIGLQRRVIDREGLFYGRIQDVGRKQQVVNVTRRAKVLRRTGNNRTEANRRQTTYVTGKGRKRIGRGILNRGQVRYTGDPYRMQVTAKLGRRFVSGRYPELRRTLNQNLRSIFSRSLARFSGGNDE